MSSVRPLKIAVHHRPLSFSERWIEYCRENRLDYKLVDCLSTRIMDMIRDADILLWHWSHVDPAAVMGARQVIASAEKSGVRVFPNTATCWHYDDKIGQKYLLESIGAPLVPTYVFYDYAKAVDWIESADFPKVFKLRCGAGSRNVRLVRNRGEALRLCRTAFFGPGFKRVAGYFSDAKNKIRRIRTFKSFVEKLKNAPANICTILRLNAQLPRERNYVYFQDFIPGNGYDIRAVVIGDRVWAFTRDVRPGDFRASGSGSVSYAMEGRFTGRCLEIAFDVTRRIGAQSLAFDFLKQGQDGYLISEISYCFTVGGALYNCPGYWDSNFSWHPVRLRPEDAILMDMISSVQGDLEGA